MKGLQKERSTADIVVPLVNFNWRNKKMYRKDWNRDFRKVAFRIVRGSDDTL